MGNIVHGPDRTRFFLTARDAYHAPTMVPIVPGNPMTVASIIANLSLVSSPCPVVLLPLFPTLFVGKAMVVDDLAVEVGRIIVAVELVVEISAAACADEDEVEELEDIEGGDEEEELLVIG